MMHFFPASLCLRSLAALSTLLCLASCASKGGRVDRDDSMGPKFQERMGKWDASQRSAFEKGARDGQASKEFKTGSFHRQSEFHTGKQFSGSDDTFNARGFAQSGKTSRDQTRMFSGADDRSSVGDAQFKTRESSMGGQQAHGTDRRSSLADDVFRTENNRTATKGLETSKRPQIQARDPDYTESQIRGLLNKG